MEEYGLTKKQMKTLGKAKPLVFLYEEEYEKNKTGIKAVRKVFCDDLGFTQDQVKLMVLRYPPVLSKTEEELHNYFSFMNENNIDNEKAMECLLECPKLISIDIDS
jgi:hypothetical protein